MWVQCWWISTRRHIIFLWHLVSPFLRSLNCYREKECRRDLAHIRSSEKQHEKLSSGANSPSHSEPWGPSPLIVPKRYYEKCRLCGIQSEIQTRGWFDPPDNDSFIIRGRWDGSSHTLAPRVLMCSVSCPISFPNSGCFPNQKFHFLTLALRC